LQSDSGTLNFAGADYIQTATGDSSKSNYELDFTLSSAAYVYILIDSSLSAATRALLAPSSMFTQSGTYKGGAYDIYRSSTRLQQGVQYTIGAQNTPGVNFYTVLAMRN